ncbi:hypothetical protein [Methanoregula sp.]|uniref:hypothetical protein n=1 Tax=Methanoregula sp. TaxID=2052170 RepID=UPI002BB5A2CB|nr:hypothetical protein [Methanoregula sp.]HVP96438.1 hypothetical protein [Methanoregula sp.]
MADITGDTLIITCGVIIVIVVLAITFLRLRSAERRMHESSYKLRAYTDLLNAVTEINLAGGDSYKMDIAKKNLALTLNRLNLIASSGVLKSVNDLLDFLNEHKEKDFDTLRLHNILNTLVIEARRDLNPSHARRVEESKVRYRFFAPTRK